VTWWLLALAAVLLGIERICYVAIWRAPAVFLALCERLTPALRIGPVEALAWLFGAFKVLQVWVFVMWCYVHSGGTLAPQSADGWPHAVGSILVAVGLALNAAVFYRLGVVGVFYGSRLGHDVPWCDEFPFSHFRHPQYVGAVLSIWGFFLVMRFPAPDWMLLPLLETAYYTAGARLER
jgi:methylene-fatty-acyl-phospholipid synthase